MREKITSMSGYLLAGPFRVRSHLTDWRESEPLLPYCFYSEESKLHPEGSLGGKPRGPSSAVRPGQDLSMGKQLLKALFEGVCVLQMTD